MLRISDGAKRMNLTIKHSEERPDHPTADPHLVLVDLFTTQDGRWDVQDTAYSVPQWAIDTYANADFAERGGATNLFALVLDANNQPVKDITFRYWSDGFDKLADPNYRYAQAHTTQRSGWANMPIYGSSSFVPERGERGPWCWCPDAGSAEVVVGGGLPSRWHVSTFAVWKQVGADVGQPTQPDSDILRTAIWNHLGYLEGMFGPLAAYAHTQKLGAPLTYIVPVNGFLVQGFAGGIVYAPANAPEAARWLEW